MNEKKRVTIVGNVAEIKALTTNKGDKMALLKVISNKKNLAVIVWPEIWAKYQKTLSSGKLLTLTGILEIDEKRKRELFLENVRA